jgi:phage repressor protein C with HTH and peptisase S24 domain
MDIDIEALRKELRSATGIKGITQTLIAKSVGMDQASLQRFLKNNQSLSADNLLSLYRWWQENKKIISVVDDFRKYIINSINESIPDRFPDLDTLREKSGVGKKALEDFVNGDRLSMDLESISKLFWALGITVQKNGKQNHDNSIASTNHQIEQSDSVVSIPIYENEIDGNNNDFFSFTPKRYMPILDIYNRDKLIAVEITSDSMEPTIRRGAIVGVTPVQQLCEGQVYLVRQKPFAPGVKRVTMGAGEIILQSDNKKYPDFRVSGEQYKEFIVGEVVWTWQKT